MAQGDLFKGFLSSTGALQEALDKGVISAERFSSIQNELLEQSENMAKVRKNMWKADYKDQKVTERMASTMRKVSEHTKKIAQMKKDFEMGDESAIYELLEFCPKKNLLAYLPEEIAETLKN